MLLKVRRFLLQINAEYFLPRVPILLCSKREACVPKYVFGNSMQQERGKCSKLFFWLFNAARMRQLLYWHKPHIRAVLCNKNPCSNLKQNGIISLDHWLYFSYTRNYMSYSRSKYFTEICIKQPKHLLINFRKS